MAAPVKPAQASGATESQLAEALKLQRSAQWRLDFVASENSMGFHADQETARVLGESIDLSRRAQVAAISIRTPAAPASSQQAEPVIGVTPPGKSPPGPYTDPEKKLAQ